MGVGTRELAGAVQRSHRRAVEIEQELNAADGRLGDGDTGQSIRRVLASMAESAAEPGEEIGTYLRSLANAAAAATGSSLGTLFVVALSTMARETKGKSSLDWSALGALMGAARDAMLARGGASLGDKTVIDSIDAVARAIDGVDDPEALAEAARKAGDEVLAQFRGKVCRIGRARMFGDKSIGIDDSGMLAFARLLEAVAVK